MKFLKIPLNYIAQGRPAPLNLSFIRNKKKYKPKCMSHILQHHKI